MSTAIRRSSIDPPSNTPNMRRASMTFTNKTRPSIDISTSGHAALIMTSAQTHRIVPVQKLENTYRLEPTEEFAPHVVRDIMKKIMEELIGDMAYDATECTMLSAKLADVIKQKVKEVCIPRYKLVTSVSIGQLSESTLSLTSRCIWNEHFDKFAEYTYTNGKLYAVGLVYGLFCE